MEPHERPRQMQMTQIFKIYADFFFLISTERNLRKSVGSASSARAACAVLSISTLQFHCQRDSFAGRIHLDYFYPHRLLHGYHLTGVFHKCIG